MNEPGRTAWWRSPFSRQTMRRSFVLLLVPICLLLLILPQKTFGVFLVILLLADNALLRKATHRLAVAKNTILDERETAVRNQAYRLSYKLLAVAFGIPLWLLFFTSTTDPSWILDDVSNWAMLVIYLELLFFLPTAIIAWIEPDMPEDEPFRFSPTRAEKVALGIVAALILVPFVFSVGVAFANHSSTNHYVERVNGQGGPPPHPRACGYFDAKQDIGVGVEAEIRLQTELCWNNKRVWQTWGLNRSDCQPRGYGMTNVQMTCSTRFTSDGTMHVLYRADVSPSLLPFIHRTVVISLVVRANGRVVQFRL